MWLACAFIILYYYPSTIQKQAFKRFIRKLFYFILISGLFIFLMIFIRHLFSPTTNFEKLFNSFYIYSAGNIFLLDKYLILEHNPLYGLSLFRSFVSWFARFGLMEPSSIIAPHYEFYKIYNVLGNTFTYIRFLYEDFGIYGVIVLSYAWGWFGFFIMTKFLEKFSFLRLGITSMIMFSFFWSFYGFSLIHITTMIWKLFLLYLIDLAFLNKYKI